MLCEYGCGNEAKYQLKNGRNICCKSPNSCPVIRKKNSEKTKTTNSFSINANQIKMNCTWCKRTTSKSAINRHEKSCYLNPVNLKICPVCGDPIKDYKNNTTCSSKCARQHFSEMYHEFAQIPWKDRSLTYREICFRHHKKQCIVCGETLLVEVHHYDWNHSNDEPENLIPLCPTHHKYLGSQHKHLIEEQVDEYHKTFCQRGGIGRHA